MILQYKRRPTVITSAVSLSGPGSDTNQKHRKRWCKGREKCGKELYIYTEEE